MSEREIEIYTAIDENYTQKELQTCFLRVLSEFTKNHVELRLMAQQMQSPTHIPKKFLVQLLATIFASEKLFKSLLSYIPKATARTFEILTWEGSHPIKKLEKLLHTKILNDPTKGYGVSARQIDYNFYFFKIEYTVNYSGHLFDYEYIFKLTLPEVLRKEFKKYLPAPAGYHLAPVPTPDKTDFVFQNQDDIIRNLKLYHEYFYSGNIKFSHRGTALKLSVKNMQKFCTIQEFFSNDNKDLDCLRTKLILGLLGSVSQPEHSGDSIAILKNLIKDYQVKNSYSHLENLLFHIKGVGHFIGKDYQEKNIAPNVITLLSGFPVSQWIVVANLDRYIFLREIDLNIVTASLASRFLYFNRSIRSQYGNFEARTHLTKEIYDEAVLAPLLKGCLFLFAAFGILDLAYDFPKNHKLQEKNKKYLSVFDGLKYVQLTELGSHILGKTDTYTRPIKKEEADVLLDDERLIITLHGQDRMAQMFLEKSAENIGVNRYKIDYHSFLRGCKNRQDVELKIQAFKEKIMPDPPKIWFNFFDQCLARLEPFEQQEELKVYKLKPDKDLHALIATDEILKKYILKAENFHIIINKKYLPIVKKRLATFGYLVPGEYL